MQIEDFQRFYSTLHKQHPEILGAEWNKETKALKVFYQDGANEVSEDVLSNIKLPTILIFRKKVPKLDSAIILPTENEIVIETFNPQKTREELAKKYQEFEEVSTK